jgi:hypothetical protein
MENHIKDVHIECRRWDAAEAVLWITVRPERITATTEVRGRLVGPRGPGASTVEVAYPFQPLPQPTGEADSLTVRVLLPDPCAWSPQRPFVYEGWVELWQDGQCADRRPVEVRGREK